MSKIELTISPNYVPSWGLVDAIRELFQNALDQEAQCHSNTASWDYARDTETLTISNATSSLTTQSLLLGQTTKLGNASTLGQFGEGYKIATLVLLREHKNVTFYNYGAKEIWRPRFVKSRKFGTDILTFFIEKQAIWSSAPSANLSIVVENISHNEYLQIVNSNLHLQSFATVLESTVYGDVIDQPGRVYANGLFVCEYAPYVHGYNFKPEYIKLDRDRKMVSDFDLRWLASRLWASTKNPLVLDMIVEGAPDVAYVENQSDSRYTWSKLAYEEFLSVYGPEAIPVVDQLELSSVPTGYHGVIVSPSYAALIKSSSSYIQPSEPQEPIELTMLDPLLNWFEESKARLSAREVSNFQAVLKGLEDYLREVL